ncbi:PD-(D/E)XK nuclease family protein [Maribacter chungangensis]|uniref:PD-(D/E)XK nuclease family protein n=1 Tax=Maribacter chungangensis TaxID=1069117 RepID=A0ABW3B771_9FLAO
MRTFINEVIDKVWEKHESITDVIFILPSKRAGTFIKEGISIKAGKTMFAPVVYSIEEFIEKISGLSYATATEQLFELYSAYLQTGNYEKETFDTFLSWGETLLQDFNEVDRYLVNAEELFSNLSAIQEINHWSTDPEKTTLIKNYLSFWQNILPLYQKFNSNLLNQDKGHQGLVYRQASENINQYILQYGTAHVFLGFNALNEAESRIIQALLQSTPSEIYWDIDPYFLDDKIHDAGLFIRQHREKWPYLKDTELKGTSNYYGEHKHIEIIGVPKTVSQAKYTGNLLYQLQQCNPKSLKDTALILGDEALLTPLLNSIPDSIPAVNITMGQKLELTPLAGLFLGYFDLHEQTNNKGWFYKDFITFITHPFCNALLNHYNIDSTTILVTIKTRNWTYITLKEIENIIGTSQPVIPLLFSKESNSPKHFLEKCNGLVTVLKETFIAEKNNLILEQLYKFHTLFSQIDQLAATYDYITNLKALKNLFKQLLSKETLDFQGDPLEGLQLMGMLESRNLDFETVLLTSVNEGILPSGKSNNSFIPFDLKIAHKLPTYKEKDAVYTYHFYRLLQRAKNIYILYNTEPDVLEGGEKSRLITQLLTEENRDNIIEKIASPQLQPIVGILDSISKSESLMHTIVEYANEGFSPSSLSNYIRNPVDFYKQNLLGIKDTVAVEETIAANTFGTIVHDALEELYTPYVGTVLSKENLIHAKTKLNETIHRNFLKTYMDGDIGTGKNYLSFHVIKKYISNFIDIELKELEQRSVKIIALEQSMNITLHIKGIDHPVTLKGKLDRIDEIDGTTRIIDYKTGRVERNHVEIMSWENLIHDYKYSKAFQLLCYAYMYAKKQPNQPMEAGIISLKNLNEGTLLFALKEAPRGPKNTLIDTEVLFKFEAVLHELILEIHNQDQPFLEKEV